MQSVLVILVVLGCISMGHARQCYRCNSAVNASCGTSFNANALGDGYKMNYTDDYVCMKEVTESKGGITIDRGPLPQGPFCIGGLDGCGSYDEQGKTITVCCCKGELCNGASAIQQQLFITIFLTCISMAIFIRQHR